MAVSPKESTHERTWRNVFFYFSALMGALALVDFDAGRLAHGMGDAGVACLMLSLMTQFPFVRAIVRSDAGTKSRDDLLREVEKLRNAHPWADRLSAAGWLLLLASLVLRAAGVS
ncbi:MAG: hypothetical protein ACM3PU_02795 [Gemmatimonadota bacterium]